MDICDKVNTLEESNQTAFHSLEPPIMFSDFPMLLGMFRFYALWIPFLRYGCCLGRVSSNRGTGKVKGRQYNPRPSVDCGKTRTSHSWKI